MHFPMKMVTTNIFNDLQKQCIIFFWDTLYLRIKFTYLHVFIFAEPDWREIKVYNFKGACYDPLFFPRSILWFYHRGCAWNYRLTPNKGFELGLHTVIMAQGSLFNRTFSSTHTIYNNDDTDLYLDRTFFVTVVIKLL